MDNKVIIITGNKGDGKTTKIRDITDLLKDINANIAGFVAVGSWRNGERSSYTLIDLLTDEKSVICTDVATNGYDKQGRFYFNPKAIEFGKGILANVNTKKCVVVIDEIGPFELDNKVWHSSLRVLLDSTNNVLLLSVREKLVKDVVKKYNLNNTSIYNIEVDNHDIVKEIMQNVV